MDPETDEGPAGGPLTLGNLAFVVREDIVLPAGMDIDLLTEKLDTHGGTFDVPPWETGTPVLALPFHPLPLGEVPPQHMLCILPHTLLPEGKVCGMLFSFF